MKKWKPWQLVFLAYLLLLNLTVFCVMGYFLLRNGMPPSTRPLPQPVANVPTAASMSISESALTSTLQIVIPTNVIEQAEATSTEVPIIIIPPVNIQPVPPPVNTSLETTSIPSPPSSPNATKPVAIAQLQEIETNTSTPSPTNTYTPQPSSTPMPTDTSTPTPTSTHTPTPTPTSTPSPTNTPRPTFTLTRLPTRTPSSTATKTPTNTPRPTATSTRRPTHTPGSTATKTPTNTPRPTATSMRRPTHTPTKTAVYTPTPSPTRTATNTAQPSATPTNIPTPTNTPTPRSEAISAVAANSSTDNASAVYLVQPDHNLAGTSGLVDVTPLTNDSMALSWTLAEKATQYRIYSDMGSGSGVYVYKARTTQPAFVDKQLRSGMTYSYRLTRVDVEQEVVIDQIKAGTFADELLASNNLFNSPDASTASVVAAPTALPADAILLGLVSNNNFTDDFNTLTLVGEVRNDSNLDVGQTDITVTFYDTAGTVIGTVNGHTLIDIIPPGEKSPFHITLTRPPGFASYSLRAIARSVPPQEGAQLDVVDVKRFEDDAGFFHIKGSIKNEGNSVARRTKVAAIIYGRDGDVINVGFTYVNPPNLNPGEQATYDVVFAYYPRYFAQQVIPFEE